MDSGVVPGSRKRGARQRDPNYTLDFAFRSTASGRRQQASKQEAMYKMSSLRSWLLCKQEGYAVQVPRSACSSIHSTSYRSQRLTIGTRKARLPRAPRRTTHHPPPSTSPSGICADRVTSETASARESQRSSLVAIQHSHCALVHNNTGRSLGRISTCMQPPPICRVSCTQQSSSRLASQPRVPLQSALPIGRCRGAGQERRAPAVCSPAVGPPRQATYCCDI